MNTLVATLRDLGIVMMILAFIVTVVCIASIFVVNPNDDLYDEIGDNERPGNWRN